MATEPARRDLVGSVRLVVIEEAPSLREELVTLLSEALGRSQETEIPLDELIQEASLKLHME